MITVTPPTIPQNEYPVARQSQYGTVVVFLSPTKCVVIRGVKNISNAGDKFTSVDINDGSWTPVDITITG